MDKCPFCEFDETGVVVYSDDLCFAIISTAPIKKYHVLVIPKQHYKDFTELPPTVISHLFVVTQKLSAAVRRACEPIAITHLSDDDIAHTGYNLIPYYKIHIIPRFKDDKVMIEWNRQPDPGLEVRAGIASEIKQHLNGASL